MPGTTEEFFNGLEQRFRSDKATGLSAVYQFVITGEGGGAWTATLVDGACTVAAGQAADPSLTLTTSVSNWERILGGDLDPQLAFMTGRLRIKGDMGLAMRLRSLFL